MAGHPQGRRPILNDAQAERFADGRAPLMITEFGGITMREDVEDSWGYDQVESTDEYAARLTGLFDALRASSEIVGFCYTQFMDTGQETNGLLSADGTPKLPVEEIHRIVTGRTVSAEPPVTFGTPDG
jgi:hypothetical protein